MYNRNKWRQFRRRFDGLRSQRQLDYSVYRQLTNEGGSFRFTGGFESITDGKTLWVQGENLLMPVSLENTKCWVLPMQQGSITEEFDPEAEIPELIRQDRVSTLTEGAKVFVGGCVKLMNNRWSFVSSKESPLVVIFYDCPDKALPAKVMRIWQNRSEYWNSITPLSIFIGAICLLYIAYSFLDRPAFRPTVIFALIAMAVPILPVIPPGLLFMILCRRLSWQARKFRAYRDIAGLPLRDLPPGAGENYGCLVLNSLPAEVKQGGIPLLIPQSQKKKRGLRWHIFGIIEKNSELPKEPKDPFVCFGVFPGDPKILVRRYIITAYTLEILAFLALLSGIGINIFFLRMIMLLLWGFSF